MLKIFPVVFVVAALAAFVLSLSLYTVDQREQAIVLQLGQPVGDAKGPGLHFKLPVVQDVRRFDRRVLSVETQPEQMVISSSRDNPLSPSAEAPTTENVTGEPIIVSTFARWRIVDPLKFMKTLRSVPMANQRLQNILNEATRSVLGNTNMRTLLSDKRSGIMQSIREIVNAKTTQDQLGIEIIDVRIVRADLTPELRQSTVRRMISELKERATETRANGEERALEIRSTAEKERTVLLAEAERDAQVLRGEGDKEAIAVYAAAFSKDRNFYEFNRSMEAYRRTLATPDTRLILSPEGSFFKYFHQQK